MRLDTPVIPEQPHHLAPAFVAGTSASWPEDSAPAADEDQERRAARRMPCLHRQKTAESGDREQTTGLRFAQNGAVAGVRPRLSLWTRPSAPPSPGA